MSLISGPSKPPGYNDKYSTVGPNLGSSLTPTAMPSGVSGETPTAVPPYGDNGSTKIPTAMPPGYSWETPTAVPGLVCETTKRWSMWIDRHTVEPLGGDNEKMTSEELSRFCQRGTISDIQCETLDGRSYKLAGDITTCTIESGLVCDEFQNYPIGCQDYRVRYECAETICQSKYYICNMNCVSLKK